MTAAYYKMPPVISTPGRDFHPQTESGREDLVLEGPGDTSLCEQEVSGRVCVCKASLPADLTHLQNRCVGTHLK